MKIFFVGIDVGVVVENRNFKIVGKIFHHIAAAGCTAAMQQKSRDTVFRRCFLNDFFKLFLIVDFVCHIYITVLDPFCLGGFAFIYHTPVFKEFLANCVQEGDRMRGDEKKRNYSA